MIVFNENDRQNTYEYILSIARNCDKIVSLVQVGSGAVGYNDRFSDLDFVIALDSNDSMKEIMAYMNEHISNHMDVLFSKQNEERHLQVFVLSNLLEIDIGYGPYTDAAAIKPEFKVIFDHSGTVEDKMMKSREYFGSIAFENKYRTDLEFCSDTVWAHLMHAAVAIKRNKTYRALAEMDFVRNQYIALLGDQYKLESTMNREIDKLPEEDLAAIKSTLVMGLSMDELWKSLKNLTEIIYKEMSNIKTPIDKEKLYAYYKICEAE